MGEGSEPKADTVCIAWRPCTSIFWSAFASTSEGNVVGVKLWILEASRPNSAAALPFYATRC